MTYSVNYVGSGIPQPLQPEHHKRIHDDPIKS